MQVGLHFDSSNSKQMEISATIQNGFTISYSGIPLRPLALFIVMFPIVHLISHFRMSAQGEGSQKTMENN